MAEFSEVFGVNGALARALPGFRPRATQRQMAERIRAALERRERLLIEAGTGTGKTFAYLVPALLSGQRVLISTGTRTLQDQLYHRDLPLLAAALGRPARVALLKGRANYLCRARLEQTAAQGELLPRTEDALWVRIRAWASGTRNGDLSELPDFAEAHPLRAQISSTRENCTGQGCAHFAQCHVFAARRAALEADIVVVNHHLLLADLALKEDGFGDLLPSVDAVILDEAHQLPDLVSEFFGLSVASREIDSLLADLRTGGARKAAPGSAPSGASARRSIAAAIERALQACHAAFGRRERHLVWSELDAAALCSLAELQGALRDCAGALREPGAGAAPEQGAARAERLASELHLLIHSDGGDGPGCGARTVSIDARGFLLRLLPLDVSQRFEALLASHAGAWVFTSATLAVGSDFSHFAGRLGLSAAATACFDSPFDFARQGLLYLPPGLPEPASAGYTAAVVALACPMIEAAGGGAFLLFTSHRALQVAAALLEGLPCVPGPLLVQGREARERLLAHFRASGRAVLLGTSSFWEGVDVQGPALRLVLIDRLPFASPEDPLVRSRIEHLESQGQSAFQRYQLPEAVLALKQGVGRLIRSEEDRGVVVLCDPRLQARAYGRVFLASLPPMRRVRDPAPVLELLRELARPWAAAAARGLPA